MWYNWPRALGRGAPNFRNSQTLQRFRRIFVYSADRHFIPNLLYYNHQERGDTNHGKEDYDGYAEQDY